MGQIEYNWDSSLKKEKILHAFCQTVSGPNIKMKKQGRESVVHATVSISEMEFEDSDSTFYYPCPCGDLFELALNDLLNGLRIATCPSCSLKIGVTLTQQQLEDICALREISPSTLIIISSTMKVQTFDSLL